MIAYRLEFGGERDGPLFDHDEEDAHEWAAANRPGERYSVTAIVNGEVGRQSPEFYEPT